MLTEEFFILVIRQVTVTHISNVSTWVSSFLSYIQGKYNKEVMIMTLLQLPIFILVRCQVTSQTLVMSLFGSVPSSHTLKEHC